MRISPLPPSPLLPAGPARLVAAPSNHDETTPGIVLPTAVSRENPGYTQAALDAGLAGHAAVDVTVDVDGSVRDVLLAKSLDAVHGLDDAALATAGRWTFKPGTLNGRPVPVRVRLAMSFSTR